MIKEDDLIYLIPAALLILSFMIMLYTRKHLSYAIRKSIQMIFSLAGGWMLGQYWAIYTLLK